MKESTKSKSAVNTKKASSGRLLRKQRSRFQFPAPPPSPAAELHRKTPEPATVDAPLTTARQRSGGLHRELVNRIVRQYGAEASGFRAALRKAACRWLEVSRDEVDHELCLGREYKSIIPDAYLIEESDAGHPGYITIYEVEVSHPVSHARMRELAELWFTLDCWEIDLRLIRVDRFGNRIPECLMGWWYAFLEEDCTTVEATSAALCWYESDKNPCRYCGRGITDEHGSPVDPARGWLAGMPAGEPV